MTGKEARGWWPASAATLARSIETFARDIKLSHTIFAMPWALLAMVLAWRQVGGPILGKTLLTVVCMVAARTAAMSANRLLDARLDALNPRTAGRALPSGQLRPGTYAAILGICSAIFVGACAGFVLYRNFWPVRLAVPVLLLLTVYPLMKRFTAFCHYHLGLALGLAPVCAWVAISGSWSDTVLIMGGAVLLWTAGFDIIYACQDYESDLRTGLVSVPVRLGIARALWAARITHAGCAGLLLLLVWYSPDLGNLFLGAVLAAIVLLVVEHWLVRPDDLSRVNIAFFTINGIISLMLGLVGIIDALGQGRAGAG